MKLDDLAHELKEKVLACKTPEDLLILAKESGYELSEEELSAVAGGDEDEWCDYSCDTYTSSC